MPNSRKVSVIICTDDDQFFIDRSFFEKKLWMFSIGNHAKQKFFETDRKMARRIIRMVWKKNILRNDLVVVPSKGLGVHSCFLVWFAPQGWSTSDCLHLKRFLFSSCKLKLSKPRHEQTIRRVSKKARLIREM